MPIISLLVVVALFLLAGLIASLVATHWHPLRTALLNVGAQGQRIPARA
jgi:hypothetical protein